MEPRQPEPTPQRQLFPVQFSLPVECRRLEVVRTEAGCAENAGGATRLPTDMLTVSRDPALYCQTRFPESPALAEAPASAFAQFTCTVRPESRAGGLWICLAGATQCFSKIETGNLACFETLASIPQAKSELTQCDSNAFEWGRRFLVCHTPHHALSSPLSDQALFTLLHFLHVLP